MDFFQGTTTYHKLSTSIRSQVVIYEINYTQVLHPILTVVLDYKQPGMVNTIIYNWSDTL